MDYNITDNNKSCSKQLKSSLVLLDNIRLGKAWPKRVQALAVVIVVLAVVDRHILILYI